MPPRKPRRLRRHYVNERYPMAVLRFEDGHEIHVARGEGRTFDAWAGETIKVVVIWDPTSDERDVVSVLKAEQFPESP